MKNKEPKNKSMTKKENWDVGRFEKFHSLVIGVGFGIFWGIESSSIMEGMTVGFIVATIALNTYRIIKLLKTNEQPK